MSNVINFWDYKKVRDAEENLDFLLARVPTMEEFSFLPAEFFHQTYITKPARKQIDCRRETLRDIVEEMATLIERLLDLDDQYHGGPDAA